MLEHYDVILNWKKLIEPKVDNERCMANLGIYDLHLHDLRSLVAQTALDNGANIYDVSALLAHSNIATTEKRYVDKNKDHAQKAIDILEHKKLIE